jgi:hypothetical protein
MEDVVSDVLVELRYAPGRDVQIHLQQSIMHDASVMFRTLMQKFIWRDWYFITPFTTNPANGQPVEDLTSKLTRYSDVLAVYSGQEERALPFAPAVVNPRAIKQKTVIPDNTKVFAIAPYASYDCILVSRTYRDTDFGLDDPVPFYRDMLVLGTAYQLALKNGTNVELAGQLKSSFEAQVQMYRLDEVKDTYSTRPINTPNVMTDWYVS